MSDLRLRIPRDLEFLIREAEQHMNSAGQPSTGGSHVNGKVLSAQAPPFIPHNVDTVSQTPPPPSATPPTDLDNIEQQRKQELLARRAVLQSMKKPKGPPSSSIQSDPIGYSSPSPHQSNGTTPVPQARERVDVDAFLAGLMTEGGDPDTNMEDGQSNEQMEVEQALVAVALEGPDEELTPPGSSDPYSAPSRPNAQYALDNAPLVGDPTEWNSDPSTSSAHRTLPPSASASYIRQQQTAPVRRNTKRPVAADFVEYNASQDVAPAPAQRAPPNRSYTSETAMSNGFSRRRHLGPTTQQRLIIDLSDDDGSTDGEQDGTTSAKNSQTRATLGGSNLSAQSVHNGREGSVSAVDEEKQQLLQQKQKEIELMRERIRLAEERKKRALKRDEPVSPPTPSEVPTVARPTPQNEHNDAQYGTCSLSR